MSNPQCINCNVRISRIRRHALANENDTIINTIRLWTYPRDITPTDHICHACWEIASYQPTSGSNTKRVGHLHVCVVCGRSILRINRRRVLSERGNEEEQRISNIISNWILPRELTLEDEACVPCWLRAQRSSRRTPSRTPQDMDDNSRICAICQSTQSLEPRPQTSFFERQNYVHITQLLENQQMPSINEVCGTCWQQAQEIVNSTTTSTVTATTSSLITTSSLTATTSTLIVTTSSSETRRVLEISLPNIRRAAETPRHCIFQECTGSERHVIPEEIRSRVLKQYNYFVPRGARICTRHLEEEEYHNLYSAEYSMDTFTSSYIEDIIFILMEGIGNINYENIQNYPEHQVKYFIGLTKRQHQQILDETPSLREMRRGSFALTPLLCKLRTGDSGDTLSCLFQVPRRTLETLMSVARNLLFRDYVPQHLGFSHMTRDQVAAKNSIIADGIFGEPDASSVRKPAITIADATYLYTQKSSNYLFQKDTYSLHKHRNLLKPFILCCCNGYIIDVRGPYNAITNDASIMKDLLEKEEFNNFFREDDIFIVDRGFRDCMDSLHDKGYLGHMPETKEGGHSQLTTLEANRSRCVTITRWVIEAVNGHFKRDFKIFRNEYFNRACPHLMVDFKIAAALHNAFSMPFTDPVYAEQLVNIIVERLFLTNLIADLVAQENLNRRSSLFVPIDGTTIYFPRLSMEDLILFACGVYQIRQARSYVGEHFRFHGIYTLEVGSEQISGLGGINPMLIRAKIKSRHSSSKTYFVFIVIERNMNGREAILSYCCNCIVGLRTVGCCSHVMSIIWYLGFARHEGITRPAAFLDEVVLRI